MTDIAENGGSGREKGETPSLEKLVNDARIEVVRKAVILAISNHKGGAGKTVTVLNLADALSRRGLRVLCIDMDPQTNLSTALLVSGHPSTLKYTIVNVLLDECKTSDAVITNLTLPKVHLISGSIKLTKLEENLRQDFTPANRLKEKTDILALDYDVILIDTPPNLGILTINALAAANQYILPLDSGSKWGLDGSSDFQDMVKRIRKVNPKLRLSGVLLTRYDGRKTVCIEVEKVVNAEYERVFETRLSTSTKVQQAEMAGQTVMQMSRQSKPSREYAALADEVMKNAGIAPLTADVDVKADLSEDGQ